MAKVVITLIDNADGGVEISTKFNPPILTDGGEDATPAQSAAVSMLESLREHGTVQVDD